VTGALECASPDRRAALLEFREVTGRDLNGIDRVEVDPADHAVLHVHFVVPAPPGAYGLDGEPSRVTISGGRRINGIRAVEAVRRPDGHLEVRVDRIGDFSTYVLSLEAAQLDPALSSIELSFMATCPTDADCRDEPHCPPAEVTEPALDYLAKDYASFRRLMLDLLPTIDPDWDERSPADLGIALVELLAYVGDELSYFQDAVANEAYLDTARRRASIRRHTRLIDYRMHDGRNAWTWVHFSVSERRTLETGTRLATRIAEPLRHSPAPPGPGIPAELLSVETFAGGAAPAGVQLFETTHPVTLRPEVNELYAHTFGDEDCCLAPGATELHLFRLIGTGDERRVARPDLVKGELLLLEEVRDPRSGSGPDADFAHRAVVTIEEVEIGRAHV
jgi:hypothetical protein